MKNYDFALNWDQDIEERFIKLLKEGCRKRGLSFVWVRERNVREILKQLETHVLRISVMLDSQATYNQPKDLYSRVCYAVKDGGGAVINDPDRAKASVDKAAAHYELINAGITIPFTVVVRNWEPKYFRLTPEEKQRLGSPFIMKPGFGYGQLGVVRDAKGTVSEIARARHYDRGDNFLLQEKVDPVTYAGRRAWFRVIHVFDTIIPCWWDDQQNFYEHVSYEHFNEFSLYHLVRIASKIAFFSKMSWFSTEVAIDHNNGKRRFVAIDYVNDQCDMRTKSESPGGIPDPVVEYAAEKIICVTSQHPQDAVVNKKYKILLSDAVVELKGLGMPQNLLRQDPKKNAI